MPNTATVLDCSDFLGMVSGREIVPPLKTWSDTLLFYLLGMVASEVCDGDIMEIGVGGSTYPLCEIAMKQSKNMHLVDNEDLHRIDDFIHERWAGDHIKKYRINSTALSCSSIPTTCYVHIDGGKRYSVTMSDIKLSSKILGSMGLICQDDYSNSRWPEVTFAVHDALHQGCLRMLIVGDSSAWLCRSEDHSKWCQIIKTHHEISMLSGLVNLVHRTSEENPNGWFFMNGVIAKQHRVVANDYHARISLHGFSEKYLILPYPQQSRPGSGLSYG